MDAFRPDKRLLVCKNSYFILFDSTARSSSIADFDHHFQPSRIHTCRSSICSVYISDLQFSRCRFRQYTGGDLWVSSIIKIMWLLLHSKGGLTKFVQLGEVYAFDEKSNCHAVSEKVHRLETCSNDLDRWHMSLQPDPWGYAAEESVRSIRIQMKGEGIRVCIPCWWRLHAGSEICVWPLYQHISGSVNSVESLRFGENSAANRMRIWTKLWRWIIKVLLLHVYQYARFTQ